MKKLLTVLIIVLILANVSLVSAEIGGTITKSIPVTHDSLEKLLEAEGDTCIVATDGINSIMIENGVAGASTLAYIENPEYSCMKHKNVYSSLEQLLEAEGKVCETATDGINSIMIQNGEAGASTLAYPGENPDFLCMNYKLSDNDMSLYNHVRSQIDGAYLMKVDSAIEQYESVMKMKRWSDERRLEAHQETINKAEMMIFKLSSKYSADSGMNMKDTMTYYKLQLIKIELELLDM